jgi:hypothetical protein
MLKVTDGVTTRTVTGGVFRQLLQPNGWTEVPEEKAQEETPSFPPAKPDPKEQEEIREERPLKNTDRKLLSRPLDDLSMDELKRVAILKHVVIDGLESKKKIRTAIRSAGR